MKRTAFLWGAPGALLLALPQGAAASNLHARVVALAKGLPGAIGVYARTLENGPPLVAYRAYERFPTASIVKVLVMTTAYVLQDSDPGTLDRRIRFSRSELIAGSDFMSNASDGETFTVRELIVPMIQVSDNTAANMLIGHFGVRTINDVGLMAGMNQTHLARKFLDWYAIVKHQDNVSTPEDMGRLLYLIEKGAHEAIHTITTPAHCRTMVDIMLGQTDRDAIPAALPAGLSVANKTGEIDGTRNDVAIVAPYGERPLILTIMTKSYYAYGSAYAAIHTIAKDVYAASRA